MKNKFCDVYAKKMDPLRSMFCTSRDGLDQYQSFAAINDLDVFLSSYR